MTPDVSRNDLPEGILLALETSGEVGSVAIAAEGAVIARRFLLRKSEHGSGIIPAIEAVLTEAGATRGDIAAVVVGAGPGSFTGMRIAAATAKGLAGALAVPLFAASSLAAAAVAPEVLASSDDFPQELSVGDVGGWPRPLKEGQEEVRYVLMDARRGRVYGACYKVGGATPLTLAGPHGGTVIEVLNRKLPLGTLFTGDGASVHADLIRAAGYHILPPPGGIPTADGVLACCTWSPVDRGSWEPDYVRDWNPGVTA